MSSLLNQWWFRAGVVAGLTWAAWKYLPVGPVGKTLALAIGGVATASVVASGVPMVSNLVNGRLPVPTTTLPAQPTT